MKKILLLGLMSLWAVTFAYAQGKTSALIEKLEPLAPFVGTWQASFENGAVDVTSFEIALKGQAVRNFHSINNGVYSGETLFVWDEKNQRIAFFYFTTGGFYTRGFYEKTDEGFKVIEIIEGDDSGMSAGITDSVSYVRDISENSYTVASRFKKDGEWLPESVRVYKKIEDKEINVDN